MRHFSKHVVVALIFVSSNILAMDQKGKPYKDASDIELEFSDEDFEDDIPEDSEDGVVKHNKRRLSIEELVKTMDRYRNLMVPPKEAKNHEGQ